MGEVFAVRCAAGQTIITEIPVRNDMNTFAPYQCKFAPGSHPDFTHSPSEGSMNRRSGEPIEIETIAGRTTAWVPSVQA